MIKVKKVVCIGGGSGQSALLRGLKQIENIELSTIVAVADNGGSTGRLRDELHLPAMGDLRNVMCALADQEDLMTKIMNYRFDSNSGELSGHNLGNIIISALAQSNNDFMQAIEDVSGILKIAGNVYPSTLEDVTLSARMEDGSVISGECECRDADSKIAEVFYDTPVRSYPKVIKAIYDADYIIIGIGSLYTSILPNLIIDDVKKALINCEGKVIYCCNCMTEAGETDGYSLEDHVEAIEKHVGKSVIDAVVYSDDDIPEECLQAYALEKAVPVKIAQGQHNYRVLEYSLLSFPNNVIRHDSDKVRDCFKDVMEKI